MWNMFLVKKLIYWHFILYSVSSIVVFVQWISFSCFCFVVTRFLFLVTFFVERCHLALSHFHFVFDFFWFFLSLLFLLLLPFFLTDFLQMFRCFLSISCLHCYDFIYRRLHRLVCAAIYWPSSITFLFY